MFKLTLIRLPWQAFMDICVTILLNTSIHLWTNFSLLFFLHYLHFILPQQFQPFYPKQQMVISTSFNFYNLLLSQSLECAIPIQLNISQAEDQYRHKTTKPTGEDNPPAGAAHSRHMKPPASAKDLTLFRKTICGQVSIGWANSSLCSSTRPSHPARIARNSNNSTSPDSDKTIASQSSP